MFLKAKVFLGVGSQQLPPDVSPPKLFLATYDSPQHLYYLCDDIVKYFDEILYPHDDVFV